MQFGLISSITEICACFGGHYVFNIFVVNAVCFVSYVHTMKAIMYCEERMHHQLAWRYTCLKGKEDFKSPWFLLKPLNIFIPWPNSHLSP